MKGIAIPEKIKSRKLWATVIIAVLNAFNGQLQFVPDDTLLNITHLVMVYIGGQAFVDFAGEKGKTKK